MTNVHYLRASHITGQVLKVDGGRNLTSSGWHLWEGSRATNLVMESKESIIASLKGKILMTSNTMMVGYSDSINLLLYLSSNINRGEN